MAARTIASACERRLVSGAGSATNVGEGFPGL
jgi:hypothetical protein